MGEQKKSTEGVRVEPGKYKKWAHAYKLSDMEVVFRRGNWQSWDEVIYWLETEGESDNELTPGETIAITEDLRSIRNAGVPFTNDPKKVFDLVSKFGVDQQGRG